MQSDLTFALEWRRNVTSDGSKILVAGDQAKTRGKEYKSVKQF